MNPGNARDLSPISVWNPALLPQEEPLWGEGELHPQHLRQIGDQFGVVVGEIGHPPFYQHSVYTSSLETLIAVKTRWAHKARMTLADRIRAAYAAVGINQAEAARRCGWSAQRFGQYANGKRTPDLQSLVTMAGAFNTTPDHLLGINSEQSAEMTDILGRLLELEGLDPETSRTIAEAASAAQQVLKTLPGSDADHDRARLVAQAVWSARRIPKTDTKLGQS